MRKRDKIKELLKNAKESLISPYDAAKKKLEEYLEQGKPNVEQDEPNEGLNWEKVMNIRIRCFHATNNAEIAKIYLNGQKSVLQEFKVDGVTSSKNYFWENDNTYIIVAEDIKSNRIVGGMRIDIGDDNCSLPLEDALNTLYPDITVRIHRFNYTIAETCALWVHKEYSERRLPMHITNACIAVASKIRIKVLVALVNNYSLNMALRSGFTIAKTVGNNGGKFFYPTNEYESTVIELDTISLNTLTESHKKFILGLRSNPVQIVKDEYKDYFTNIEYDLRLI